MTTIRKAVLAKNIKSLMLMNYMTPADLSRAIDVPYTTIRDWLTGVTYPRDDKLELIADYFNIDADALRIGTIQKREGPDTAQVRISTTDKTEVELLKLFRRLTPGQQKAVLNMLEQMGGDNNASL